VRLVIAEDSVLLRAGLVRLLVDAGIDVVGEAEDARTLLALVDRVRPDLVIADVRMPPGFRDEGIRAALRIRAQHPGIAVVVLSQYVEEEYAAELIGDRPEGVGYLLKDRVADVRDFITTLHRVRDGGTALDPEVVAQLLARSRRRDPLGQLSDREHQVLGLMAEGRSNAGIAETLVLSHGGVEKHISNIMTKLDLPTSAGDNRRVLAVLRYLEA
jgi:DNA-binding NarL/FixJ family response regulator